MADPPQTAMQQYQRLLNLVEQEAGRSGGSSGSNHNSSSPYGPRATLVQRFPQYESRIGGSGFTPVVERWSDTVKRESNAQEFGSSLPASSDIASSPFPQATTTSQYALAAYIPSSTSKEFGAGPSLRLAQPPLAPPPQPRLFPLQHSSPFGGDNGVVRGGQLEQRTRPAFGEAEVKVEIPDPNPGITVLELGLRPSRDAGFGLRSRDAGPSRQVMEFDDKDGVAEALAEMDSKEDIVIIDDEKPVGPEELKKRELEQKRKEADEKKLELKRNSFAPNKSKISLVPTSIFGDKEEDRRYTRVFKFPAFNAMQSHVFPSVSKTDDNVVVSAPTGSGKTTIFELAFLRMMRNLENPSSVKPRADVDVEMNGLMGDPYCSRPLAIYVAPTKALCSERSRDWQDRFHEFATCNDEEGKIVSPVFELTGDSAEKGKRVYKILESVSWIVITPEKLDSITRSKQFDPCWDRLRLLMIDEVHILSEPRGATLEVIVARTRGKAPLARLVAVSASVPNSDDIARWLGVDRPKNDTTKVSASQDAAAGTDVKPNLSGALVESSNLTPARLHVFGEEYRPVPLRRQVIGFYGNEWTLGKKYDEELFDVICKYSDSKPTLIFCGTRKHCLSTADLLHGSYVDAKRRKGGRIPWVNKQAPLEFVDPQQAKWASEGIAVHHGGLSSDDRRSIEDGFRNGSLHVVLCTSTLAVGVNLPAHLVVVKGTQVWLGGISGFRDYTDIEIQQMIGRAGRPQYDRSATAVIMCDKRKEERFRDMAHSRTLVESCLYQNLVEHLNSEIGRGIVKRETDAVRWLRSTFLWIRLQRNTRHYSRVTNGQVKLDARDPLEWLRQTVKSTLENLMLNTLIEVQDVPADDEEVEEKAEENTAEKAEEKGEDKTMVTIDAKKTQAKSGIQAPSVVLASSMYGRIMSWNCIPFETMCRLMDMDPKANLRTCLEVLCGAPDFQELRIRPGEAAILDNLRESPEILFNLNEKVKTYAEKVFLLAQTRYGNVDLLRYMEDPKDDTVVKSLPLWIGQNFARFQQRATRITKAMYQIMCERAAGPGARSALELLHIVNGKAWENHTAIFGQISRIGPRSIRTLGANEITSWNQLAECEPMLLEGVLKRNRGYVTELQREIRCQPVFSVTIKQASGVEYDPESTLRPRILIELEITNIGAKQRPFPKHLKHAFGHMHMSILVTRSDGVYISSLNKELGRMNMEGEPYKGKWTCFPIEITRADQHFNFYTGVDEMSGVMTEATFVPELGDFVFPIDMDWSVQEEPAVLRCRVDDKDAVLGTLEEIRRQHLREEYFDTDAGFDWNKPSVQAANRKESHPGFCSHKCEKPLLCGHDCCREGAEELQRRINVRLGGGVADEDGGDGVKLNEEGAAGVKGKKGRNGQPPSTNQSRKKRKSPDLDGNDVQPTNDNQKPGETMKSNKQRLEPDSSSDLDMEVIDLTAEKSEKNSRSKKSQNVSRRVGFANLKSGTGAIAAPTAPPVKKSTGGGATIKSLSDAEMNKPKGRAVRSSMLDSDSESDHVLTNPASEGRLFGSPSPSPPRKTSIYKMSEGFPGPSTKASRLGHLKSGRIGREPSRGEDQVKKESQSSNIKSLISSFLDDDEGDEGEDVANRQIPSSIKLSNTKSTTFDHNGGTQDEEYLPPTDSTPFRYSARVETAPASPNGGGEYYRQQIHQPDSSIQTHDTEEHLDDQWGLSRYAQPYETGYDYEPVPAPNGDYSADGAHNYDSLTPTLLGSNEEADQRTEYWTPPSELEDSAYPEERMFQAANDEDGSPLHTQLEPLNPQYNLEPIGVGYIRHSPTYGASQLQGGFEGDGRNGEDMYKEHYGHGEPQTPTRGLDHYRQDDEDDQEPLPSSDVFDNEAYEQWAADNNLIIKHA